ncbi:MAG: HAMP domain-containing histidine kinase [Candidatus Eremiobacteraeota bacterium]|nr:HAMP domain-containing histidine kinase [Candidatus Eremiobacteraeota bacterium]
MNNRIWLPAAALALIAACTACLVYLVATFTYGFALRELAIDANVRAHVMRDVLTLSQSLSASQESRQQIARQIVAGVRTVRGFDAAVVADDGTILAGNTGVAALLHEPFPSLNGPRLDASTAAGTLNAPPGQPPFPSQGDHPYIGFGPGPKDIFFRQWSIPQGMPGQMMPGPGGSFSQTPSWLWLFDMRAAGPGDGGELWNSPSAVVRVPGASVVIARTDDPIAKVFTRGRWLAAGLILLCACLSLIVAQRTLGTTMRPFEIVRSALRRLGSGDYSRLSVADNEDATTKELVEAYNAAAGEVASTVAQRQEVESNIRRFVADAGHELRTPLAVMTGYVDLLRHGSRDDDQIEQRIFSEIAGQGERMRSLIQDMLFLVRLDSQEPTDVKILDAGDVLSGVVDSFQSLANGATLTADVATGAFVQISETELRQAIGNLIDNALKYAPGSHIVARVRTEADWVVVSVEDDGPGMNPETRARAFERFARGETSGSIPGSGLGLAIVARATERARGTIVLQTEPGKGTLVELRFPAWQPYAA